MLVRWGTSLLIGPFAAIMYFQAECFDADCRATGSTFIVSMSQPGAVIGGVFVAGLVMLAARKVDTDVASLTEEVSEPAPAMD